jgi:2-polyprenyl-3-methyl-5-hydroxy-6-metoxy-1,4-benzoquinol methylase
MTSPQPAQQPTPERFFETARAFQRSAAIKAAIELRMFTLIAEGANTSTSLAQQIGAPERGVRILCDYLTVIGFLTKDRGKYRLAPDADLFLNEKSPAYIGCSIEFLCGPAEVTAMQNLTATIRQGKPQFASALESDAKMWQSFARSMAPLLQAGARAMAGQLHLPADRDVRVLDIASSHGLWGLAVADRFPKAHIVGLDWPSVVEVGKENASKMGFSSRYSTIEGDAFQVDLGGPYDLILLPNLLHHFDKNRNETLLKKCHKHLRDGGMVAIAEFVPNEDRVSPPTQAEFALTMLGATEGGDAYTLPEFKTMLTHAGFRDIEARPLTGLPQTMIEARK